MRDSSADNEQTNIIFPMWITHYIPWKMNQRITTAAYRLREVCRDLIADKKRTQRQDQAQGLAKTGADVDIISVLLRKQEIDDDGLVNQMLTFLAAGETVH